MGVSTRRQRETDMLREKVLDTAEKIFIQEGIEQVTMRRIAASIDYAPTVLYRLFNNKADLSDQLVARGYRGVRDRYIELARKDYPSPKAQLEAILAVYADYALAHPSHYRMWFDSGSIRFEEGHLYMTHGRLQFSVYQNWLDSIEACLSEGLFSGWDLLEAFQILWSRVHGLISLRLQHPDLPWMPLEQQLQGVLEPGIKA
jgi:AcrR family transcriptional regulator